MKTLVPFISFILFINLSFAGSDCVECDNLALAQTSPNAGKHLIGDMSKITKGLKEDYTNVCRLMADGEYKRAFRHLRDHHKQSLEAAYYDIECSETYGPLMEFATIGQAGTSVYAMIKYLRIMGKKHKKDYLTPILNYIEPNDPKDRSLLDVAQIAIDTAHGLEEDAQSTYDYLKKLGAKHSYYFCKKKKMALANCLNP